MSRLADQSRPGEPGPAVLGSRIAENRRERGLTAKQLADELGLPLWKVERIERGEEDASPHAEALANATGWPASTFSSPQPGQAGEDGRPERSDHDGGHGPGRAPREPLERDWQTVCQGLVLGSLAALVSVRFFSEVLRVLPRAANFIDLPIFAALFILAALRPSTADVAPAGRRGRIVLLGPVVLFLAIAAVATGTNPTRVAAAPVLVFTYGILAPFGVYWAVFRLWPTGRGLSASRLIVALGVLQFAVVAAVDLPRFIATQDPDVISGTFGQSPYQLVFFLVVLVALLAGVYTFERTRVAARLGPILVIAAVAVIFLAQFRSLLLTTALGIVLIAALLAPARGRGAFAVAFASAALIVTLSVVSEHMPALKFGQTVEQIQKDPSFFFVKRLETADIVKRLYTDEPRTILTGTGPGTFSSRGWQTFAQSDSTSDSNVQGKYALALTGGRVYSTDVSEKYVLPQLKESDLIGGSRALDQPFASYIALAAETGVLGLVIIVAVYLGALVRGIRMSWTACSRATVGDPLPALLIAGTVALFTLIQMGFLENWLEVTRVTFTAWALFAIGSAEFAARYGDTRG